MAQDAQSRNKSNPIYLNHTAYLIPINNTYLPKSAQVLLHALDASSEHVDNQVPAICYLAFRYGGDGGAHVSTALTVSSSLPGQSCLRTALLGVLLGLAHGEACLPDGAKEQLRQHLRGRRQREARLELARLRKRLARSRYELWRDVCVGLSWVDE